MKKNILVINGPNLNLLGEREPTIYGNTTLRDIEEKCKLLANSYNASISFFQSNIEGEIINRIQKAIKEDITDIIINAAGYSHTSIAILDALKAFQGDIYEVHISNIFQREAFRSFSYISKIATACLSGFKGKGYEMAIRYICEN